MKTATSALGVLLLLAVPSQAQRTTAELGCKKHEVAIDYGAVRVGKHSLSSLPVGSDWRMGMNQASQIRLSVPLVAGDAVAAPGSYRVKIHRAKEQELHLMVEGAGHVLGGDDKNVFLVGKLEEPKKPAKKLALAWSGAKKNAAGCDSQLEVNFGDSRLVVPVVALGVVKQKGKAFTADVFTWEADAFEARGKKKLATPVATLRPKKKPKKGEPVGYNLVVSEKTAKLVPLMSAPTSSFGFGAVDAPAAEQTFEGEIKWSDAQVTKPVKVLKVEALRATKTSIGLEFVVGERRASIEFELAQK